MQDFVPPDGEVDHGAYDLSLDDKIEEPAKEIKVHAQPPASLLAPSGVHACIAVVYARVERAHAAGSRLPDNTSRLDDASTHSEDKDVDAAALTAEIEQAGPHDRAEAELEAPQVLHGAQVDTPAEALAEAISDLQDECGPSRNMGRHLQQ